MIAFHANKAVGLLCLFAVIFLAALNLPDMVFSCGGQPPGCGSLEECCENSSNHIVKASGNLNLKIPMFVLKTKAGPINVYLTYNSQGDMTNGPFGYGWLFFYDIEADKYSAYNLAEGDVLIKKLPDGSVVPYYPQSNDQYEAVERYFSVVDAETDESFIEELKDGLQLGYSTDGLFVAMTDTNGNDITFNRDTDGYLESIVGPEGRSITFTRTGAKITQITDPAGYTYDFAYSYSNLISYSSPEGVTTTFQYTSDHVMTQKNKEGDIVKYTYDDDRRVIERENEEGNSYYYAYDTVYYKTTITDPRDNYRIVYYNDAGNLLKDQWFTQTGTLLKEEEYYYGADGKRICFIDGEGNKTIYNYDQNGNMIEELDALSNTYYWEYDANNNLIKETDKRGNWTEYSYDANRNLLRTTWNIGTGTAYEDRSYYADGLLKDLTNARGYKTEYEYDSYGNLSKISEPLGKETTFSYDTMMGWELSKTEKIDASTSRTTSYEYDDDGRRTKITYADGSYEEFRYDCCHIDRKRDRNGNYTYLYYTGTGKLEKEVKGNRTTEYDYDKNDNLIKKTVEHESDDRVTEYSYDAANRLIEEKQVGVSSADIITQYTYTGADKIASMKQKLGGDWITTNYVYDALNRRIEIQGPSDADSYSSYDANSNMTGFTDVEGRFTSNTYDEKNRLETTTNPLGVVTEYAYDNVGNRVSATEAKNTALERTTSHEYNALDQLTKITDDLDHETARAYDYLGNMTTQTDANDNGTTFTYDTSGRLVSKTNAEGNTVQYEYDYNGNRTKLTDPNSNWSAFSYNEFNELISITYPDNSTESYTYDKAGNPITKTTRASETIDFLYDEFNRMVTKEYPDTTTYYFTYDQLNRMTAAYNGGVSYGFSHNDWNQLTQADFTIGSESYTVSYELDKVGNKTKVTYPDSYYYYSKTYDDLNRINQAKDRDNNVLADYTLDSLNRKTRLDYLNNTWTTYTHNSIDWLTSLTNWATETVTISFSNYTHDDVGNRLSMIASFGTQTFDYNKIYELTEVDYPSFYSFSDMTYYYDSTWNRTTTVNGGTTGYIINSLNQYTSVGGTSFTHDTNGNLTSDGVQTYYYDCESHLTKVVRNSDGQTLGEYKYDPFGKRVQKIAGSTTTNYVYDQTRYQVLAEYEDSGGGFSLARHFVYGGGVDEPLMMHQSDTYYYYHRDGLGSIVNLTDSSGATVKTYYYNVYGDFSSSGSLTSNPYAFTGRRYDSESGLFLYRARYYEPEIGRFLQADPMGYEEGPNLYSYVHNDPSNNIDPYGTISISDCESIVQGEIDSNEEEVSCPDPPSYSCVGLIGCTGAAGDYGPHHINVYVCLDFSWVTGCCTEGDALGAASHEVEHAKQHCDGTMPPGVPTCEERACLEVEACANSTQCIITQNRMSCILACALASTCSQCSVPEEDCIEIVGDKLYPCSFLD